MCTWSMLLQITNPELIFPGQCCAAGSKSFLDGSWQGELLCNELSFVIPPC